MKRVLKISGAVAAAVVILLIGIAIGSSGKTTTAGRTATRTVTHTVTVPGPTVTKTVRVKPAAPATAGPTMPGDGTFAVGTAAGDWAPGTWQTSGAGSGGNCYWATLSNLTGNDSSIIANDNTSGPTVLTVSSGDAGVQVSGCNAWHREG